MLCHVKISPASSSFIVSRMDKRDRELTAGISFQEVSIMFMPNFRR